MPFPDLADSIEWVPVWDPGNPPDDEVMAADQTTGYGSVPYEYSISKYLITNEQYVEFLNAVARSRIPTGSTSSAWTPTSAET